MSQQPFDTVWLETWSIPEPNTGCWLWLRSFNSYGWPVQWLWGDQRRTTLSARKLAYEVAHGQLKPNMVVRDTCGHTWCVNPNHLRAGTRSEITRLRLLAGRGMIKLNWEKVRQIRKSRLSLRQAAPVFGVSDRTIWMIRNFLCWNADLARKSDRRMWQRHNYGRADLEYRRARRAYPGKPLTRPEDFDVAQDRRDELIELSWLASDFNARRGGYEYA